MKARPASWSVLLIPLFPLLFLLAVRPAEGQSGLPDQDPFRHVQVLTDTLYKSQQRINLIYLDKNPPPGLQLELVFEDSILLPTSQLGRQHEALAAINGGFFNMDRGGSVSYLESQDSVIHLSSIPGLKWAVADSILNAALVLHRDSGLIIEHSRPETSYASSTCEEFVLVAGPILLKDSVLQSLPDMDFTHMRHPRSCVGITAESIIFITVDGRSDEAAGMSLQELQSFALSLGCLEAINLDGGGSTTMWTWDQGIVNVPSDRTGERPVANALIIRKQ
jgi:exopolysaccharide biosynthesis protein